MFGINTFISPLTTIISVFIGLYLAKSISSSKSFTLLFVCYICYLLITGLAFLSNDMPVSLFFTDIKMGIIPAMFYFIGNSRLLVKDCRYYNRTLIALAFCFILGYYFYLVRPDWYLAWKKEALEKTLGVFAGYFLETLRFSSFFGASYFTGFMSLVAMCISLSYLYRKGYKTHYFIMYFLSTGVVVLAQQRISIAMAVLVLLTYFIYSVIKGKKMFIKLIGWQFVFMIIIVFFVIDVDVLERIYEVLVERLSRGADSALEERTFTWYQLLEKQSNFVTGHGFGTAGHAAYYLGYTAVTDGEFFKMLYETGLIGLLLFFSLVLMTLYRGVKYFQYFSIELPIILFFFIAMVGANPFTLGKMISIFWFAVGRVWNKEYLDKMIMEKDKI